MVEYFSEEETSFAPFYDKMKAEYGGELPFVVNPFDLSASELLGGSQKVRRELGDCYPYTSSAHKVLHDIHIGRLEAPAESAQRNFGIKRLVVVCTGDEDIVIDFVQPVEGS